MDTLSGETMSKVFSSPSEKGSILQGKNLLPLGANSFLVELTPFQKGIVVQLNKQESLRLSPSVVMAKHLTSVFTSLKYYPAIQTIEVQSIMR